MHKRSFLIAATVATSLVLAGCAGGGAGSGAGAASGESVDPSKMRIAVSLPSQDEERWISDGKAIKEGLEKIGYQVDMQYANNDIPTQQQQLDQMLTKGADLLLLAPLDGTALAPQLQTAVDANIPIMSYDRLIRNNADVDLYVTFDNFKVGAQQATSLLVGLGVLNEDGSEADVKGPFNIELFGGSLDDNNATLYFEGAMSVLQKYIDNGTLEIRSGQDKLSQITIENYSQDKAQERMDNLVTSTYTSGPALDGVLTPNDSIARGVITSLRNAGYGPTLNDEPKPMPITTGQDAEVASVKSINEDVQFSTVFKDTRVLAEQAVRSAQDLLEGEEPEVNDTETYDNGAKVVPSFLVPIQPIYKNDIETVLIGSGYYTADEVKNGRLD